MSWRVLTWCVVGCLVTASAHADEKVPLPAIHPQLAECTLEVEQQRLKPVATASPPRGRYRVGELRFDVEQSIVRCWKGLDPKPLWTAETPDQKHVAWLTSSASMIYLQSEISARHQFLDFRIPALLRRFDVANRRWLPDLPGAVGGPAGYEADHVIAVLEGQGLVIVLGMLTKPGPTKDDEGQHLYSVAGYRPDSAIPVWSKTFPVVGERSKPGAYLLAVRGPAYANSELQHLTWLGDRLLVCPEAVQPIYCLNPDTGTELWRVERPWETVRGFIGPSVWQHFIGSPGKEKRTCGNQLWRGLTGSHPNRNEQSEGLILGGPIVVPRRSFSNSSSHNQSWFVALAKGPRQPFGSYVADCTLYEFNAAAEPVAMLRAPQAIVGRSFAHVSNGVVWQGQNDSFVKILASKGDFDLCPLPGGSDKLIHAPWFHQATPNVPDAWFTTGRGEEPVAFGPTHVFYLPSGGYVSQADRASYRFPLTALSLQTGQAEPLTLHVPFRGDLWLPRGMESDRDPWIPGPLQFPGPYVLSITDLHVTGTALEITLSKENWSGVVRFDLSKTDLVRRALAVPTDLDLARQRVKALRQVDAKDPQHGMTALIKAAHAGDAVYVQALLEAGADVNARSNAGYVPLTMAAGYGSAEVVELLIKAGADVNYIDRKRNEDHWDMTPLLYAANSSSESKRKVRALLRAGANPKATAEGSTALLEAAGEDSIDTVELLLEAKFDVNQRQKDGSTALMLAAARGNDSRILGLLIKAGADVNAQDNEGLTPLMYAAKDFGSAAVLQTLLAAGADLKRKDKEGRTAVDYLRESDDAERVRAWRAVLAKHWWNKLRS